MENLTQKSIDVGVWKEVTYPRVVEGRYLVSEFGDVYDIKMDIYKDWSDNGAGYKVVGLKGTDTKQWAKITYVHRLVAHTFIDNPEDLPQVGHKDHTRANNNVDNLYWTTPKQNTADGIREGKINAKKRPNTKKLTKAQICEIALLSSQGKGVNEIAIMLDFPRTTISSVFNGRSNWELFEFAQKEIEQNKRIP
ncbi:hypothetical protein D3C86_1159500 [compost metagenome]